MSEADLGETHFLAATELSLDSENARQTGENLHAEEFEPRPVALVERAARIEPDDKDNSSSRGGVRRVKDWIRPED